ncbi:MAG: TIGR04283 family arsenosugar biosynthesis glycosyltransferase [Rhizobiales bacterium]|nr:TIGR04283 family arsenosugar biosynthesis glycosyltransferase [Hyphomicrobiales bacterium]
MISIVIPTLNAADGLPATLEALVQASVEGLVGEVIISDGGSSDATEAIAEAAGCKWVSGIPGRGQQLAAGAKAASKPWLLFLHADTILDDTWISDARQHMALMPGKAASFKFTMASPRTRARIIEKLVDLRCRIFALPYGDQGLLIEKHLYDSLGGYKQMALMEDVEFVRRIGRRRLRHLRARATSSAIRYERDGYFRRSLKNIFCVSLYFARVPIATIKRIYV